MILSMAAILRNANAPLSIEAIGVRPPGAGEVLIEMKAAGLCHTDLHVLDGRRPGLPMPMVLGHEGAGVVVECGPGVTEFEPGDHVLSFAMPECRHCGLCTDGKPHNFCDQFIPMSSCSRSGYADMPAYGSLGTFSQYANFPVWSTVKIQKEVPLDLAVLVSCGVATGVGAVLFTAKVPAGADVAVFGLGGVGLSAVQGARLAGAARIIGVDVNQDKEAAGRDVGMTHFVNARETGDVAAAIRDITGGGADYSFECVGNDALLKIAFDCIRTGYGVCTAVGAAPGEIPIRAIDLMMGKRLIGTMMGGAHAKEDLPRLLDHHLAGRLDLEKLISHRLPFTEINHGFDLMRQGQSRRAVVTF